MTSLLGHPRLAMYSRQRGARDVTPDELALLDELANELTRLQNFAVITEEANTLRPSQPSLRQGVEALRDEMRVELKNVRPEARADPIEVISRITAQLDGLL